MQQSAQDPHVSWWKNLLYSGYRTNDELILRQTFFINTFAILGFSSVTFFGISHFLDENYNIAFSEITGGIIFILSIIYLRISNNISVAKILLLLTQGSLLIIMLATGGTANTGIFWYFTFPITAYFLIGKKKALVWILMLCIATLIVYILKSQNYVSLAYTFIEIRQMLAVLLVISILINLYQNSLERSEERYRRQTEQLQITKRAIEQAKAEDEAILASLGEGMITMGTSGNIFLINNIALNMLQLQNENTVGKSVNDIIPIKDIKGNAISFEEKPWYLAAHSGASINKEYVISRKDNLEFPIELTSAPVMLNNQIIAVIVLFKDITEEKRLDRTKSEFVALASHQLRTPISAIAWFTEMLLAGDAGPINEEQKENLTQVYDSNKRMAALVDALLNVSRLEMANFSVLPVPTNLPEYCHKILLDVINKQISAKKLQFKENYDQQIGIMSIDQDLMKIILQNILNNAIKYTPENGTITFSVYPSDQLPKNFDEYKTGGIIVSVTDTGYGIPKSNEQKIFTKLFRADNIKSKDTDGTGLGLYIVKSILDFIGGEIWFESEENKGTTFYILLPRDGMKGKTGDKKLVAEKYNG